jgi:hypothetical protein
LKRPVAESGSENTIGFEDSRVIEVIIHYKRGEQVYSNLLNELFNV